MVYTTVPTFVDGERFTQNEANTYIRDNLEALRNPPTAVYTTVGHSSDYSTTNTSFADIDSINMALSITTTGDGAGGNGDVMLCLSGTLYSSSAIRIYFRFLEDGNVLNADDGFLVSEFNGLRPICIPFLRVNASPASHIYKVQWKVSSGTGVLCANAGTSTRDTKAQFWVREMS
jgi:hypothetical protein